MKIIKGKIVGVLCLVMTILVIPQLLRAGVSSEISKKLDSYNVKWDVPGPTSAESMPLGNGDIGLNVWVEENGDLCFYVGKTDAWSNDVFSHEGLYKLGKVRVSFSPALDVGDPLTFQQELRLHQGEILITAGAGSNKTVLRVWVDANNPAIRVEFRSAQAIRAKVSLEAWRKNEVILPGGDDRIVWYHRNGSGEHAGVANLTFGALIEGAGFESETDQSLVQSSPGRSGSISIYPLTAVTDQASDWVDDVELLADGIRDFDLQVTKQAHDEWWDDFWGRSWIFIDKGRDSYEVTQGYLLQRFITICGGRGAYPIKFNGSIFNVDLPAFNGHGPTKSVTADYREWGGRYWFQNTRAMYWPRLAAGDFDVMLPLFNMYAAMIPANAAQVKGYYGHEGAYFAEISPFWGGLPYAGVDLPKDWTLHYFTPILELSMMMLDYYEFTGDTDFAEETLLPVATAGVTFYDQHFSRDESGEILFEPANSIEMYWKVSNPAPDIAALRSVIPRLIALPSSLVSQEQRNNWQRMLNELPELPTRLKRGKKILLPYTGEQTAKARNTENPELYSIYPFRLYGLGKPDLEMARDTFSARKETRAGCWMQDPIQAAMIGFTDVARKYVTFNLTNKEPLFKFPAFWAKGNDYMPDQDNGGNGEHGLQQMLMQTSGKKILLLPAWPKDWDVDFKMNAPYETTVQGRVVDGEIIDLVVTPASRASDVIDFSKQPIAPDPVFVPNGDVRSILSPDEALTALQFTKKGEGNTLSGEPESGNQVAGNVLDGNFNTKYFNRSKHGISTPGLDAGFMLTVKSPEEVVTAFQFATADDMPNRDPYSITIEGTNTPDASAGNGSGFVLLYDGPAGLAVNPGRKSWGRVIEFRNSTAYKCYRVLVTETLNDSDATQYSEFRLGTADYVGKK